MPLVSNADLDFAIKDLSGAASPNVVTAASSTYGIVRTEDVIETNDGATMQRRGTTVTIRTGTIVDLEIDLPITVDGVAHTVRWFDRFGTGSLTKVLIAEETA